MRAAVMHGNQLHIEEFALPPMGPGLVRAKVKACGICGSDLHFLKHASKMKDIGEEIAANNPPPPINMVPHDLGEGIVMGHEFCCEVLEVGPGVDNVREGDLVVSMPVAFDATGVHAIGYSNLFPGGYSEQLMLSGMLLNKVPNGLSYRHAALTEPMAVGVHAVNKSRIVPGESAVVIGCGPVGLACIAALKAKGIAPIVAADFSQARRALAARMGAHEVVDPRVESGIDAWRRIDGNTTVVQFEAVGVPGMIDRTMLTAPKDSRILIVGVCMEADSLRPLIGIGKELTIQFALGYDPFEFAGALQSIAEGVFDVEPLITGSVGIDGVPQAFEDLADPELHAKILVEP
jgi:threonine dehydrogenase-like Zn-dependent dehydrogenase